MRPSAALLSILPVAFTAAAEVIYERPQLVLPVTEVPESMGQGEDLALQAWWETEARNPDAGKPLPDPGPWEAEALIPPSTESVLRVMLIPATAGLSHPVQVPIENRQVIARVVILTEDGRLYSSPRLDDASPLRKELHLDPDLFQFSSKTTGISIDGRGRTRIESIPDLETVAISGVQIAATYRDGEIEGVHRAVPDFSIPNATMIYDGQRGQNGAPGNPGTSGRDGANGRNGEAGEFGGNARRGNASPGSDGRSGGNGANGLDGKPADHGQDGGNGGDAPSVRITVRPLTSPFSDRPLARYDFNANGQTHSLVLPWAHGLLVSAQGGDGGDGGPAGNGGRGGNGGAGGRGGDGGDGGNGSQGFAGERGRMGQPGGNGSNGGDGGDGSAGGPGGDGAPGGNGGLGGNGGSGAVGGAGGKGGRGGSGGNGGLVTVVITGDAAFQGMAKEVLTVDITQGRGGAGGKAGKGGAPGQAGSAGPGGNAGSGGRGGDGGRGGEGGMGGMPGTREVPYTDYVYTQNGVQEVTRYRMEYTNAGRAGNRGPDGRDGVDGPKGSQGRAGLSGTVGKPGVDGIPGAAGIDGTAGKYELTLPQAPE